MQEIFVYLHVCMENIEDDIFWVHFEQPMLLYSLAENSTDKIEMTVRLVAELAPTDVMNLQIFNIIVRKCLEAMQLEEMGRNFFDRHQAQRLDAHRLELWPGYKTTLRNHEHDILLGVEVIHKVLRLDSCLHVMMKHRGKPDGQVTFPRITKKYFHQFP